MISRRNLTILALLTAALSTPALAQDKTQERWPAEKAWQWHRRHTWPCGFNFVPSNAVNDTDIWQAETFDEKLIDRELGWARRVGYNTCRVFLQFIVWKEDPEGFKKRMDRLLALADRNGLSVMPVLFDDCMFGDPPQSEPYLGKQRDPQPGLIGSSWTPSPGHKAVTDHDAWPALERYVKDLTAAFGQDQRVLVWDLYNEPGNCGMGNNSLPLLEAAFQWARANHPAQPLTAGVWTDSLADLNRRQLELSDIISFHAYANLDGLEATIARYKAHDRPSICTEWMARLLGSNIVTDLPLFAREGVGCYAWGLVNGRTQCQFPWWSKKGDPEPAVWFHDLLRPDGTPFSPAEIVAIQRATVAAGVPRLHPLFDFPVRDTCVCLANGTYYLTGTTGHPTWWKTNEGVRIWKSADLKTWEPLGLVWSIERDGTWQKPVKDGNRAVWAPELHYIKGNFWIAYCINYPGGGTGLLKSTTGKPEGPYVDVKPDGPLTSEIDASIFEDDDGRVYFVYQNGKTARLKEDMTALAEEPHLLKPANAEQVGFEGAFIFKANGRYYLSCADFAKDEYHCMAASADKLMGPYGDRYLAIPHGGHNMFFQDKAGAWWSTLFGNDPNAPFTERPAILRVEFGLDGHVRPLIEQAAPARP